MSGFLAAGFADRFDRKRLLLFFYFGFMLGTLLCGLATTYTAPSAGTHRYRIVWRGDWLRRAQAITTEASFFSENAGPGDGVHFHGLFRQPGAPEPARRSCI